MICKWYVIKHWICNLQKVIYNSKNYSSCFFKHVGDFEQCFLFKARVGFLWLRHGWRCHGNDPHTETRKPFRSPRNRCTWASCTKDSNLSHFRFNRVQYHLCHQGVQLGFWYKLLGKRSNMKDTSHHVSIFPFLWVEMSKNTKKQNIPNTRMPWLLTLLDPGSPPKPHMYQKKAPDFLCSAGVSDQPFLHWVSFLNLSKVSSLSPWGFFPKPGIQNARICWGLLRGSPEELTTFWGWGDFCVLVVRLVCIFLGDLPRLVLNESLGKRRQTLHYLDNYPKTLWYDIMIHYIMYAFLLLFDSVIYRVGRSEDWYNIISSQFIITNVFVWYFHSSLHD